MKESSVSVSGAESISFRRTKQEKMREYFNKEIVQCPMNQTPTPRLGSLHDMRRVVSLKETKQVHSQQRMIRPTMPKEEVGNPKYSMC